MNLRFLVEYGVLAPPRGSEQFWSLRVGKSGNVLELWANEGSLRAMTNDDAARRELHIGCGAELAHARLALRQLGARETVDVLPDPGRPALIARIAFVQSDEPDPESQRLLQALAGTADAPDRGEASPFAPPAPAPASEELLAELAGMCSREGAILRWASGDARGAIGSALSDARPPGGSARAGLAEIIAVLFPLQRRSFRVGALEWTEEHGCSLDAPVLAVIATPTDSPEAWVATGQALGGLLLRARLEGLHASFRDTTADLAAMRARMVQAVPQVLFRLGRPRAADVVRCEIPRYGAERPSLKRLLSAFPHRELERAAPT